jgi:hypothetical protein
VIIHTPGSYPISPPLTARNSQGVYYQVRILNVTEVDIEAQKVYCPELGWIGWDLPVVGEGKK